MTSKNPTHICSTFVINTRLKIAMSGSEVQVLTLKLWIAESVYHKISGASECFSGLAMPERSRLRSVATGGRKLRLGFRWRFRLSLDLALVYVKRQPASNHEI